MAKGPVLGSTGPRTGASLVQGAAAGTAVGLLACVGGASYLAENGSIAGIGWAGVAAVFVTQLALSGAFLGALLGGAKATTDRWLRRRTSWAPAIASMITMAIAAAPSAAFAATYFGALRAPFMGAVTIFTISSIVGIGLATTTAFVDQSESAEHASISRWTRLRRAFFASVGMALPIVGVGGLAAAATSDEAALHVFRMNPALLGAGAGAGLGALFGLYVGLVVGALRRREARASTVAAPKRVRVAALPHAPSVEEAEIDPLAEEEAELEAKFAELERLEMRRTVDGRS